MAPEQREKYPEYVHVPDPPTGDGSIRPCALVDQACNEVTSTTRLLLLPEIIRRRLRPRRDPGGSRSLADHGGPARRRRHERQRSWSSRPTSVHWSLAWEPVVAAVVVRPEPVVAVMPVVVPRSPMVWGSPWW